MKRRALIAQIEVAGAKLMNSPLSSAALREFVRLQSDHVFFTRSRRVPFSADIVEGTLVITPHSSRKPRRLGDDVINKVCAEHAISGSLRPGDYHDITFDSSYLVALIAATQAPGNPP